MDFPSLLILIVGAGAVLAIAVTQESEAQVKRVG